MKVCLLLKLSALALLAAPSLATAQQTYAAKDLHLRAGPARDYPVVAVLPSGADLFVQGCLGDYTWCDVSSGPLRGWVYAGNIDYSYQGNWVPILGYGAQLRIGVVTFIIGDYWPTYYRDRPWFRDRDRWMRHPPPRLRPPPHRPLPLPLPRSEPGRRHPQLAGAPGAGRPQGPQRGEPPHAQPPQRGEPPRMQRPQRGEPPRARPPQRGGPGGDRPEPGGRPDRTR